MRVAIGMDHGGLPLREALLACVKELGHEVIDFGTDSPGSVDYPDYAEKVGLAIQEGQADRGVLVCGSGVGVCISANKVPGVYAAICHDCYSAKQGVEHDSMNVLCLGGRIVGDELAKVLVAEFLSASFIGNQPGEERHARRVEKIIELEHKGLG
jgi:ribose 5-phosphate isomerase B